MLLANDVMKALGHCLVEFIPGDDGDLYKVQFPMISDGVLRYHSVTASDLMEALLRGLWLYGAVSQQNNPKDYNKLPDGNS